MSGSPLPQQISFLSANQSAFGTLETGELTPILNTDFVYGLNIGQLWNSPITGGTHGNQKIDTNNSRLRIQSGTGATGYTYISTRKIMRYRAGMGYLVRFTPLFSTGHTGNLQFFGMGSISGSTIYDGLGYMMSGITFGIGYYKKGVLTFYSQNGYGALTWNGSKCNGSSGNAGSLGSNFNWNPNLGTPVMLKIPFLGYGDSICYVQDPYNGSWIQTHTLQYANTSQNTEFSNPSFQFVGFNKNIGNTVNQTMYCGSIGIFISGSRNFISNPKWAMDANLGSITTEVCILNIRNSNSYNGIPNRGMLRLNTLSAGLANNSNNNIGIIRLKINAHIGGTPVFHPVSGTTANSGYTITNGSSIASYDTAGTTVSGGLYVYNFTLGTGGNLIIDLTEYEILVAPGETLSITGSAIVGGGSDIGVSLNWTEDV